MYVYTYLGDRLPDAPGAVLNGGAHHGDHVLQVLVVDAGRLDDMMGGGMGVLGRVRWRDDVNGWTPFRGRSDIYGRAAYKRTGNAPAAPAPPPPWPPWPRCAPCPGRPPPGACTRGRRTPSAGPSGAPVVVGCLVGV